MPAKVAAVVPTCRGFSIPVQSMDVDWIIVHDQKKRPVKGEATHIVAPDPEMYGQRCDSIRSAGFALAYERGADYILTVDDDCEIPKNWAHSHVDALHNSVHPWWYTTPDNRPRGLPYDVTSLPVAISHGLWNGMPDLDGQTQLGYEKYHLEPDVYHENKWQRIGTPFPQSSMNLGFRREVACVMYQPFQGELTPFDRFADIWCGLFAQKALEGQYVFMNGGACVYHRRASNAKANFKKEMPGRAEHETLWKDVWNIKVDGSVFERYAQIAGVVSLRDGYFDKLTSNMLKWLELTSEDRHSNRLLQKV